MGIRRRTPIVSGRDINEVADLRPAVSREPGQAPIRFTGGTVIRGASSSFWTRQCVVQEVGESPYIGFERTDDKPDGWIYNIKRWCSPFDLRIPTLPKLSNVSTQGVNISDCFKSGVGDLELGDLKITEVREVIQDGVRTWLPVVNSGSYYRYDKEYHFYGDHSMVEYPVPTANRENRNYIELTYQPKASAPILAATFRRDKYTQEAIYDTKIQQVYKFSGQYSSGTELDTVTAVGKILWDNVNTNHKEFLVDNTLFNTTRLFFNRDYIETIGLVPTTYSDLKKCELVGVTNRSAHMIYYGDDITIYVQHFYLCKFPIVIDSSFHLYFADTSTFVEGVRQNSWWELISATDTNSYWVDRDLGIVYFAATNPGLLPRGGRQIYATYKITPRVEYERLDKDEAILATEANVNPVTQALNQGFVCVTHADPTPLTITLTIDKPRLSASLYGPITIGSDYATLKAHVAGVNNISLPNIPVFFTMTPNIGFLNGDTSSSAITNKSGDAYTSYQPPVNAEDLGYYTTDVTAPNEIVIHYTGALGWDDMNDIYTYQILKDDIIQGYKTVDDFLLSLYYEMTPAWVIDATTYAKWATEMREKYDLKDFPTEPIGCNVPINGRKVVLYKVSDVPKYDATAIHPVTGETGAIVPVRPLSVTQLASNYWKLTYESGAIAACGASEDIGGYWLIASKTVTFQAYCWSDYYNRYIYSNKITAKIMLPNYLLGEYINTSGQKIPFGWKIPSETDITAMGLGGATFITINPVAGPYQLLDLVNETGATGEWASAPYETLGIKFNVEES